MSAAAHLRPVPDPDPEQADGRFGALGRAIADELVLASGLLGDLAYDLGSDPATLRRHMASLQQIDRVTQIQLGLAALLRDNGSVAEGVAAITLEDVHDRLTKALG